MKLKKKAFFILVLFLLLIGVAYFAVPKKTFADTGKEIQLLYAKTISKNGHIYACGYVQTKSTNPWDTVVLHYQVGNGEWKDVNANYIGRNDGTYGLWYFEMDGGPDPMSGYSKISVDFKFAIKITKNSGETFWDNNNGQDYKVSGGYSATYDRCVLGASNLVLTSAHSWVNDKAYFSGDITLKNLAYVKDVKVRYSYDNWASFKEVPAYYNYTQGNGLEIWSFRAEGPADTNNFQFALSYTVNGQTYWDNNFQSNYTVNVGEYLSSPGLR